MRYVTTFDVSIIHFLNQFAQVDPAFDRFVGDVANSPLLKGGLFMAYFWWQWFRVDKDTLSRRRSILVYIAGALLAVAVSRFLQDVLPFHTRPLDTPSLDFALPAGGNPDTLSGWNSFPSDHATLFFALTTAVWYQSRRLGILAALWTFFVICVPRVYLGYHYPSDIIGGAVLGIALMVGVNHWTRRARWPARIVEWSALHQTAFYCIAFLSTYEISVLFYDVRTFAQSGFEMLRTMVVASL